jgi:hypothetical protein
MKNEKEPTKTASLYFPMIILQRSPLVLHLSAFILHPFSAGPAFHKGSSG